MAKFIIHVDGLKKHGGGRVTVVAEPRGEDGQSFGQIEVRLELNPDGTIYPNYYWQEVGKYPVTADEIRKSVSVFVRDRETEVRAMLQPG